MITRSSRRFAPRRIGSRLRHRENRSVSTLPVEWCSAHRFSFCRAVVRPGSMTVSPQRPRDRSARLGSWIVTPSSIKACASTREAASTSARSDACCNRELLDGSAPHDQHGLALRIQDGDGSVKRVAMLVIGLDLSERRPEFFQRETVNCGIDLVDSRCSSGKLHSSTMADTRFWISEHRPYRWISASQREDRCSAFLICAPRAPSEFPSDEWGISRRSRSQTSPAQGAPGHCMACRCRSGGCWRT